VTRSALLAVLSLVVLAPAAAAETFPDSTVREAWRLPNGLEVRTEHVPGASGVAVTVAYRAGSGYEPEGLEGLSELVAEVAFTAAAGDIPERTRAEMASLRPLGWESRPGTRLVRFTEIASVAQFPGVLQQVATRMRGVQADDAAVRRALADVRRDRGQRLFGDPADVLYWRSEAMAHGFDDERLVRAAGLPQFERYGASQLKPWLQRWYHAGNASLGISGDLSAVDVRALVNSLFGSLPGGTAMPDTVELRFHPARRAVTWKDLDAPVAVIACQAPALTDSLHPGFFLGMLFTGPALTEAWGGIRAPLRSRFQYSLLDEPELVRFYPPAPKGSSDTERVAGALHEMLVVVGGQQVVGSLMVRMKLSVRWLLGGTIPPDILRRMAEEPGGLGTLSNGLATRALWKGDGFWKDYLDRFDRLLIGHSVFYPWITQPEHQSLLLLTPAP